MTYRIDYRSMLNERQFEAVMHHEGTCLVIAGAGTGKTTILAYRVVRLIEDGEKPEGILLLTFTRKAAENMIVRCSKLEERCQLLNAYTFHGFAYAMLKKYSVYTGYEKDFTVIDPEDAAEYMILLKEEMKLNSKAFKFPDNKTLLAINSKSITKMIPIPQLILRQYPVFEHFTPSIAELLKRYQALKKEKNVMDYDDLLKNLMDLIEKNDFVRNRLQEQFKFIMVDEYQDTDWIQAAILKSLSGPRGNLMVVGDDAQSIYAFRGAEIKNILSFPEEYEGCKKITIERNYRSTRQILGIANHVMHNAGERFEKNLFTDKLGEKPLLIRVRDNHQQSRVVADEIENHLRYGGKLKEVAVLIRNGMHSYDLEFEMNRRGLPFRKFGGSDLASKAHIKDLVCFLKVGINKDDIVSWSRILKLFHGIGDKKSAAIIREMTKPDRGLEHLREIGFKGLYELAMALRLGIQGPEEQLKMIAVFYRPILQEKYQDSKKRWGEIELLIRSASDHSSVVEFVNSFTMKTLETDDGEEKKIDDYVTISTIHSAKGLEWSKVFVICVNDGCIPCLLKNYTQEIIDEEVRLFHVALTRAKDRLFLISPKFQYYGESKGRISPFLSYEMIERHLEVIDQSEPPLPFLGVSGTSLIVNRRAGV